MIWPTAPTKSTQLSLSPRNPKPIFTLERKIVQSGREAGDVRAKPVRGVRLWASPRSKAVRQLQDSARVL